MTTTITAPRGHNRPPLTFSLDQVEKLLPCDKGTTRVKLFGNVIETLTVDVKDFELLMNPPAPAVLKFSEPTLEQWVEAFNQQMRAFGSKLRRRIANGK